MKGFVRELFSVLFLRVVQDRSPRYSNTNRSRKFSRTTMSSYSTQRRPINRRLSRDRRRRRPKSTRRCVVGLTARFFMRVKRAKHRSQIPVAIAWRRRADRRSKTASSRTIARENRGWGNRHVQIECPMVFLGNVARCPCSPNRHMFAHPHRPSGVRRRRHRPQAPIQPCPVQSAKQFPRDAEVFAVCVLS